MQSDPDLIRPWASVLIQSDPVLIGIGVREGILLWGRKKFALKITICPKNKQFALKLQLTFSV